VFYNASGYDKEPDKRTRDFLRFVCTNDPSEDDFSSRLLERVEKLKRDEHFKEVYAAMNLREMDIRREERQAALAEGMQIGLSKGLKQGLNQGIKQGLAEGKTQGAMEKSVEAAVIAVQKYNARPEVAAKDFNAPLPKVLEKLGQ
jgi:flagellar biosynthesis/type III secretory pathway protein FliH